jgi:hypothetical protein
MRHAPAPKQDLPLEKSPTSSGLLPNLSVPKSVTELLRARKDLKNYLIQPQISDKSNGKT